MKNKQINGKWRVIVVLIIVIVIMSGVGLLLNFRLRSLLQSFVERQVTEQAKTLAALSAEQFELELRNLESTAKNISSDVDEHAEILDIVIGKNEDASMGILCLDGTALLGRPLSFSDFPGIQNAFRGNSSACYKEGQGILFTTPIFDEENVKYTLYKLYDEKTLMEKFAITCYGGQGQVAVIDQAGQVIVPFSDVKALTERFLDRDIVKEGLMKLSEKLNVDTAAAVSYRDENGEAYLFTSEVKQLGIYLVGTVPETILMDGISTVTVLILWVFGLLILMFAVGMVYLLSAEEKVRESDELREAKNAAEQASRAKSDFLANMSHEIRTPINVIMGMNEMVLRESKDEEIRKLAVNIQSASKTLLSLINDILDFSKIEAGKMEIISAPYDVVTFLNDVINMTEIKAKQKNLAFQAEIDPDLPSVLCGDEVRNRQIIVNILNNAVKYTKQGSVQFRAEGIREENVFVLRMQVLDTGIGIKEEDLDKLFEGFQRLDLEQNRNIEGTGLGLAITHNLVEQMNGRMEVSSEYGKGSVFTVCLQQEIRDANPIGDFRKKSEAAEKQQETIRSHFTAPDAKVLAVDDNEMNLEVVKALLKNTNIQITTCMSGAECLRLAAGGSFDVILLDHMMPEMDGIETLARLRKMGRECSSTPVIALTANAIIGEKEKYIKAGFDDYLPKPIGVTELETMLLKYIPEHKVHLLTGNIHEEQKSSTGTQESEPLINVELGVRYCTGSRDFYMDMLQLFCDGYGEHAESITKAFHAEDWKRYTVFVHGLKSTSLNIGGERLSKAAKELENAGKELQTPECPHGDPAFIREHQEELMDLYRETVREAERILSQRGSGQSTSKDKTTEG